MILQPAELLELYEGVIKPFEHPDPLGYLTRAIISSGGDSDFYEDGRVGFMPVNPTTALQLTGANEVFSLQSNVVTTLSIDRLNFEKYQGVNDMILAFHFDDFQFGNVTRKQQQFIDEIDESRSEVNDLLFPRFATVDDVVKLLQDNQDDFDLKDSHKKFFEFLLQGNV